MNGETPKDPLDAFDDFMDPNSPQAQIRRASKQDPLAAFDDFMDPNSPASQKRRAEQQDPLGGHNGDAADVKRALEIEDGLRPNEIRFIEDMSRLMDRGGTMTVKQRAWLNTILIRFGK